MSLVMAFVVGAMGVFLMMGGLGEGQEATACPAGVAEGTVCIKYPENGSGTVAAYTAVDPGEEGRDVEPRPSQYRQRGLRNR